MASCCRPFSKSRFICPDNVFDCFFVCCREEIKPPTSPRDTQELDDLSVLKSLADGQKPKEGTELPPKKEEEEEEQYVPDESDSTKSRRLVEDYDSTKNGMDEGKYQGARTSFTRSRTGPGLRPSADGGRRP